MSAIDETTEVPTLRLRGSLDVRTALEVQRDLNQFVHTVQTGVIDFAEVESVDSSILQMLVAVKHATHDRIRISVEPHSEVAKWFELSGLMQYLTASPTAS